MKLLEIHCKPLASNGRAKWGEQGRGGTDGTMAGPALVTPQLFVLSAPTDPVHRSVTAPLIWTIQPLPDALTHHGRAASFLL
jgi:hypothetical protein